MPVTPDDLLTLAHKLSEDNQEVSWRCAASRAYYAAYHKCKFVGKTLPEPPYNSKPQGSHDTLIKKFTTQHNLTLKAIGFILKEAKDIRVEADYEIEGSFEQSNAEEVINLLNRIYDKLQLINNGANTK